MRPTCLLLALCLCTVAAHAAVTPAKKCKQVAGGAEGGWSTTSSVPEAVFRALLRRVAAKQQLCKKPSIKLLAACSQVVAGMNYEVRVRFACKEENFKVKAHAVVWQRLPPQSPKVTEIAIIKAGLLSSGRRLQAKAEPSAELHTQRVAPRPRKDGAAAAEARKVPRRPQTVLRMFS